MRRQPGFGYPLALKHGNQGMHRVIPGCTLFAMSRGCIGASVQLEAQRHMSTSGVSSLVSPLESPPEAPREAAR